MNVANNIRARQIQDFGAVFLAHEITVDIQVPNLDLGAHGTITQQDLALQLIKDITHSRDFFSVGW